MLEVNGIAPVAMPFGRAGSGSARDQGGPAAPAIDPLD
jgi:hypothetical protein